VLLCNSSVFVELIELIPHFVPVVVSHPIIGKRLTQMKYREEEDIPYGILCQLVYTMHQLPHHMT